MLGAGIMTALPRFRARAGSADLSPSVRNLIVPVRVYRVFQLGVYIEEEVR